MKKVVNICLFTFIIKYGIMCLYMKKDNLSRYCTVNSLKLVKCLDVPNTIHDITFLIVKLVKSGYIIYDKNNNFYKVKSKDITILK